ncbi:MAG: hypothetical protein K0U52_11520 [Gammaproteobacteria bacterium]|nr:hypothetical protein [Gammaproteobacteria bacterium]
MNKFLTEKYDDIIKMAWRICKSPEAEDVAHYAIEQFMTHKRGQELVDKGQGMLFLSGIIHRSFHSGTSPYHKLYRQSGRVYSLHDKTAERLENEEYDFEIDLTIEAIQGILEDMEADTVEQWYRAKLFNMWLENSNYSELSRITGIPRTSISQAVNECKDYIKNRIEQNGINT